MIYVILYYIASTLVYMGFGTSSSYWACFNMVSILGCFLCFLSFEKPKTLIFKKYLMFASYLTVGRILFTISTPYAPLDWIYEMGVVITIFYFLWLIIHTIKTMYNGGLR